MMLSCLVFFPFCISFRALRSSSTALQFYSALERSHSLFGIHFRTTFEAIQYRFRRNWQIEYFRLLSLSPFLSLFHSLWQSQSVKSHDDSGRCDASTWIDKENWNNNGPTLNPNRIFSILPLCIDNEQLNRWLLTLGRWETQIEMVCTLYSAHLSTRQVMMSFWFARNCCVAAAMALRCGEQIEYLLFISRMLLNPRFDVSRSSCGGRNFLLREFHLCT